MAVITSVLGVLYIISSIHTVSALRCVSCSDVANPFGCGTVTECGSGESCSIQESVTPKGLITYTLGCRPSLQCTHKRRGVGDIAVCTHCCTADYCNTEGCGVKVPTLATRGPKCFNCSSSSPDGCTTTMMCALDQECGMLQTGQTWTGSCLPKPQCVVIESIQVDAKCHICCTGDYCKDRWLPLNTYSQCAVIESIQVDAKCHICCTGDYCNDRCIPIGTAAPGSHQATTDAVITATSHTTVIPPTATHTKFTAPTTTAQKSCVDQPVCTDQDLAFLVCKDPTLAASECPRKCGYCGDSCTDVLNCTSQGARAFFCADKTMAVKYCRRSCGKCGETAIPVTLNACGDPVELSRCELLHENLCMCNDVNIRELCKNYCDGRCSKRPGSMSQCQGVTSLIGKRSELLQHLNGHSN